MQQARIESTILASLLYNEEYLRKCYPFLKAEYFNDATDNKLFQTISTLVDGYNKPPSKEAVEITLQNDTSIGESLYEKCLEQLGEIAPSESALEWIVDESEAFCKRQSVFNAVSRSINIIEGKERDVSSDAIPSILQEALSVAFNTAVGHDYLNDAESRYEFYQNVDDKIPFKLDMLNKITKGGVPKKSLTCFLCPTGGGKSVIKCDQAAYLLTLGKNVIYFTAEMAEERISERIDANLMDVEVDSLKFMPKAQFLDRIKKISSKSHGRLIVKEFPTASAHVGHMKAVIDELRVKKNFVPDAIFVDYLNIFTSQRYKAGSNANSYTIMKSVAEELRGMAVEYGVPVYTSTQVNRGSLSDSDIEMGSISESAGVLFVLDLLLAIIPTPELDEQNLLMVKQLKNRFGDTNYYKRFTIGKNFAKMQVFDVENSTAGMMQESVDHSKAKSKDSFNGFTPERSSNKMAGKNFDGITF